MPTTTTQSNRAARRAATRRRSLLVADLFCGAGGSSTGAKRALSSMGLEMVLTCVNHWPTAINTHSKNHPDARHFICDLASANPMELVPEGFLDLLMASPSCTHHSRARGGKPTSDQQRMDPWHIIDWCTMLRVKRLLIENVPEYLTWGPVNPKTGKPLKSRKGQYFEAWLAALRAVGFKSIEYRVLNAADFGDATTRERFFLMARSDDKPIVWPEPTHSKDGGASLFGHTEKWRAAREVIDWQDVGRSIFDRARPLAANTIRRIATGLKKFGGTSAHPFLQLLAAEGMLDPAELPIGLEPATRLDLDSLPIIIQTNKGDQPEAAARPVDQPVYTVMPRATQALVDPTLEPFTFKLNQAHYRNEDGRPVSEPLPTIVTKECRGLATPSADAFLCGNRNNNTAKGADEPLPTMTTTTGGGIFLAEPTAEAVPDQPKAFTIGQHGGATPRDIDQPIATIATGGAISLIDPRSETAEDAQLGFVLNRHGDNGSNRGHSLEAPLPTATGRGAGYLVEAACLVNMKGRSNATAVDQPAPTITAHAQHLAVVEADSTPAPCLVMVNHGDDASGNNDRRAKSVEEPLPTVTTNPSFGLAAADAQRVECLVTVNHSDQPETDVSHRTRSVDGPLPAVTTKRGLGLAEACVEIATGPEAFLTPLYGSNAESAAGADSLDDPLSTVTAQGNHHAVCEPFLTPFYSAYVGTNAAADSVREPLASVTTKGRFGLCDPYIVPQFGEREGQQPRTHSINEPVPAVTSHGAGALVEPAADPLLVQVDQTGSNGACVRSVEDPVPTVVTKQNVAVATPDAAPFIVSTRHTTGGPRPRAIDQPLPTITGGGSQVAVVDPTTLPPEARPKSGRLVLIGGVLHVLDIRFRMLRNRELARAMSFTDDETEYEFTGTTTEVTRQIGNAVPVRTATALVASLCCGEAIKSLPDREKLLPQRE